MRYVNVQRRREGRSRRKWKLENLCSGVEQGRYLSAALGTVTVVLVSLVLFFAVGPSLMSPPSPSLLVTLIFT